MSTQCAPGYDEKEYDDDVTSDSKYDDLHVGCWAEHDDGSLLFVKGVDDKKNRVVYSLYDMSAKPVMDFTDAMPTSDFKSFFTYGTKKNKKVKGNKWTWHDKTPFPWAKVIKSGARDGTNFASARDLMSQASRIAKTLRIEGKPYVPDEDETDEKTAARLIRKLKKTLDKWGN